jgi:hypothetical protein
MKRAAANQAAFGAGPGLQCCTLIQFSGRGTTLCAAATARVINSARAGHEAIEKELAP